jgi:hypothetical protein
MGANDYSHILSKVIGIEKAALMIKAAFLISPARKDAVWE